jgi:hypothetical protein
MKKKDIIQILLNLLAFVILIISPGGKGTFWSFLTFTLLALFVLLEIILSKDKTALWVWITKTLTYIFLTIKFLNNMGDFKIIYGVMVLIAVITFIVSKKFIQKRIIAMWGTNVAYLIGAYMYINAVFVNPEQFNGYHILFWLTNVLSYFLLIREVIKEKKPRVNLNVPVFAFIVCLIYILIIVIVKM